MKKKLISLVLSAFMLISAMLFSCGCNVTFKNSTIERKTNLDLFFNEKEASNISDYLFTAISCQIPDFDRKGTKFSAFDYSNNKPQDHFNITFDLAYNAGKKFAQHFQVTKEKVYVDQSLKPYDITFEQYCVLPSYEWMKKFLLAFETQGAWNAIFGEGEVYSITYLETGKLPNSKWEEHNYTTYVLTSASLTPIKSEDNVKDVIYHRFQVTMDSNTAVIVAENNMIY